MILPENGGSFRRKDTGTKMIVLYGLRALPVCAGGLMFALVLALYEEGRPNWRVLSTYQELSGLLREKGRQSGWYHRRQRWLTQNGGTFHYGSGMTPVRYLAVRFVLAALGMAVGGALSWGYGAAACAVLFFLPSGLLVYLNGRDNERMLPELKLVFHGLELQIRAGVYVLDALAECYGNVQERRLRRALLELAGDVVIKADAYDALDRFQRKFDNRYVDSLCIILLQALESGRAVELLGDIGEQIKDMEETVLKRRKGALDRSITFYQLGILAVVLAIALYACVTYMFGAAAGI